MTTNLTLKFAWILFLLGFIGIVGSTIFFPLLSAIIWRIQNKKWSYSFIPVERDKQLPFFERLIVLIPAHNEELTIEKTIESVKSVASILSGQGFLGSVTIIVGDDNCTDNTVKIATKLGAQVISDDLNKNSENSRGKWQTLCSLIQSLPPTIGQNELVALVDAGTCWETNECIAAFSHFRNPHIAAISPTYTVNGSTSFFWFIERWLKRLENISGGPISVHGATVVYRRNILIDAFAFLKKCANLSDHHHHMGDIKKFWYNDDVVIPLTIRTRQDQPSHIWYSSVWKIIDTSKVNDSQGNVSIQRSFLSNLFTPKVFDYKRRQRMVWGNIQWIQTNIWRKNFYVLLLALRRILRLFWAYWISSVIVGASLLLGSLLFTKPLLVFIASLIIITLLAKFSGAFLASLSAPSLIFLTLKQKNADTRVSEKIKWN